MHNNIITFPSNLPVLSTNFVSYVDAENCYVKVTAYMPNACFAFELFTLDGFPAKHLYQKLTLNDYTRLIDEYEVFFM